MKWLLEEENSIKDLNYETVIDLVMILGMIA